MKRVKSYLYSAFRIPYSVCYPRYTVYGIRDTQKAFTILEVILASLLIAVLIGSAAAIHIATSGEFASTQMRNKLRLDAVLAFERLAKDLNEAEEITSAQDSSITFWWQDTDGDELRDANELVTFSKSSGETTLEREGVVLAYNVDTFQINYYDLNNSALAPSPDLSLAQRDSLRRLDVELKLILGYEEIWVLTSIFPRNLQQTRGPW